MSRHASEGIDDPGVRDQSLARSLVVFGLTLAATVLLARMGHDVLALPRGNAERMRAWLESTPPPLEAIVVIRLVAMVAGAVTSASMAVLILATVSQSQRVDRLSRVLVRARYRSALESLLGLTITVGMTLGPAAGAHASTVPPARAVLVALGPHGSSPRLTAQMSGPMSRYPSELPTSLEPHREIPVGLSAANPMIGQAESPIDVHLVRPGDHLWGIAEQCVQSQLSRPPREAEVSIYWRRLVAANPQLVDPDLIRPGEPIALPRMEPAITATSMASRTGSARWASIVKIRR